MFLGVGRYITSNLALLTGRSTIFLSKVLYGSNYTNYSFILGTSPTHHGADCVVLGNRAKELSRNLVLILIQGTSANCIESCKLESNGSSTLVSTCNIFSHSYVFHTQTTQQTHQLGQPRRKSSDLFRACTIDNRPTIPYAKGDYTPDISPTAMDRDSGKSSDLENEMIGK